MLVKLGCDKERTQRHLLHQDKTPRLYGPNEAMFLEQPVHINIPSSRCRAHTYTPPTGWCLFLLYMWANSLKYLESVSIFHISILYASKMLEFLEQMTTTRPIALLIRSLSQFQNLDNFQMVQHFYNQTLSSLLQSFTHTRSKTASEVFIKWLRNKK